MTPPHKQPTTSTLMDEKFLTVAELATILRTSKMTIYRMVNSGDLDAIRVGRSFRIPEAAAQALVRSRTSPAAGTEAGRA